MEMDIDYVNTDDDIDYEDYKFPIKLPDISENLKKKIQSLGGTDAVLFAHKKLCNADVGDGHRPSFMIADMYINNAFYSFLRDDEKILLYSRDQYGFPKAINTVLLDLSWDAWSVPLWKRVVDCNENVNEYELGEPWLSVVRENELSEGDMVQLWAFRVGFDKQLWLALVKVEGVEQEDLSLASLHIR